MKTTTKKHWIAYLGYLLLIVIAAIIGTFFFSYHSKHPERIPDYMLYSSYVISILLLYIGIKGMLPRRSAT